MIEAATVLGYVLAPTCAALVTALVNKHREVKRLKAEALQKRSERDEAMEVGLQASLRRSIVDTYDKNVVNGEPMSVERRHEIDREFWAYKTLGGNGTGAAMYEEICKVPITILK